jgi:hypothetical protein
MQTPLPHPVPTMMPNTIAAPAAAPSEASESTKQFGVVGDAYRPANATPRSRSIGCPINRVELAFFTSPVFGLMAPGIATPTLPRLASFVSAERTRSRIATIVR